jgi:hypothetical protein
MALTKATLQMLSSVTVGRTIGGEIPVQFNPTSLRLATTNQSESGQRLSARPRQYLSRGSTKLTLQLVFDTADEGTSAQPVSVRGKTRLVTQFLEPRRDGQRQSPPAVRFHWGELIFEGIMDSATEDIDLFASNGTPLRAKVDVQITGQRVQDLNLSSGPGATEPDGDAPEPGELGSGEPGTEGGGGTSRTATALGGESAAAFAARNGMNPAAWRSFADQVPDPLSLPAGLPINIGTASAGSGLASTSGIEAGDPVQSDAALDAARSTTVTATSGSAATNTEQRRAGFALASVGGVAQAIDSSRGASATAAADGSRRAFGQAAAGSGSGEGPSRWYGFGVPLRQRITPAAASRAATVIGARAPGRRASESGPPTTDDPTIAPWSRLPRRTHARRAGDRVSRVRRPAAPCGCGGGCGCGCGGH